MGEAAIGEACRSSGSAVAAGFDLRHRRRLGGSEGGERWKGNQTPPKFTPNAGEISDRVFRENARRWGLVGVTGLASGKAVGVTG